MTARRRSSRQEAGWTRQTYCLAILFITLAAAVTALAAYSNPTSQLSVCCYALVGVGLLSAFAGLIDRRK